MSQSMPVSLEKRRTRVNPLRNVGACFLHLLSIAVLAAFLFLIGTAPVIPQSDDRPTGLTAASRTARSR